MQQRCFRNEYVNCIYEWRNQSLFLIYFTFYPHIHFIIYLCMHLFIVNDYGFIIPFIHLLNSFRYNGIYFNALWRSLILYYYNIIRTKTLFAFSLSSSYSLNDKRDGRMFTKSNNNKNNRNYNVNDGYSNNSGCSSISNNSVCSHLPDWVYDIS